MPPPPQRQCIFVPSYRQKPHLPGVPPPRLPVYRCLGHKRPPTGKLTPRPPPLRHRGCPPIPPSLPPCPTPQRHLRQLHVPEGRVHRRLAVQRSALLLRGGVLGHQRGFAEGSCGSAVGGWVANALC